MRAPALADNLRMAIENGSDPEDKQLRAWFFVTLGQLRDAGDAGCDSCMDYLAHLRLEDTLEKEPSMVALAASLAKGPPGPVADAGRAVFAAIGWDHEGASGDDEQVWAAAAKYIGAHTAISANGRTYIGKKGLEKWLESLTAGYPAVGHVMTCDAHCCRWPFVDDRPHKLQITRMCFDAQLHLSSIATELSGTGSLISRRRPMNCADAGRARVARRRGNDRSAGAAWR